MWKQSYRCPGSGRAACQTAAAALEPPDFLRADDNFFLGQVAFQPLTEGAPVIRVDAPGHNLDDGDGVAFGLTTALPQALSGRSRKAGRSAELVRQFFQKAFEPLLPNRLGGATSFARSP